MNNNNYQIQEVEDSHYTAPVYDSRDHWISYWYQIDAIKRSGAKKILEIGPGTGTTTAYLRSQLNLDVTTFDYDSRIKADIQGDIREIGGLIAENSYDAVLAFEILEHIPFDNIPNVLEQIACITRRHFLVSVPHRGNPIQIRIHAWRFNFVLSRKFIFPWRNNLWEYDGMHYWEIGAKQYPLQRVVQAMEQDFEIKSHYFCPDYSYHYFFECEKKQNG